MLIYNWVQPYVNAISSSVRSKWNLVQCVAEYARANLGILLIYHGNTGYAVLVSI